LITNAYSRVEKNVGKIFELFVTLPRGGAPHLIEGNGDFTVSVAMTLSRLEYHSPPVLKPFFFLPPSFPAEPASNVL
jgi:hypothetical protein